MAIINSNDLHFTLELQKQQFSFKKTTFLPLETHVRLRNMYSYTALTQRPLFD